MKKILASPAFVSWSFLLLYLSTQIVDRKYTLLFGSRSLKFYFHRHGDVGTIILIYIAYFIALYFITKKYDIYLKNKLSITYQIILHAAVISLLVLVASIFMQPHFELMFKLGLIWLLALLQWLISEMDFR